MTNRISITFACAPNLASLLGSADEIATAGGAERIGTEHVFLALLRDVGAIPVAELRAQGLDAADVLDRLLQLIARAQQPTNSSN
ncbi:Clp protease N-terminal domain-containing protein [Nocardia acidivorans]|uniref:Clp protease N-terminal domain-containing protein n=1 Tax=Nocardia acidivorans TaxID=404580 RepID=UPI0008312A71|nr:Clp protease N-terminal domain-containing protein [Nocardia acidivorans]